MDFDTKQILTAHAQKAWTLLDEFKAFAFKGNVVDLAIGVIIGGSFHKIVDSLVTNLIMPLLAAVAPGHRNYLTWQFTIRGSTVHYGQLLGDVVHFVIIAACLFLFVVKFLGWIVRTKKEETKTPPPLTKDQELLSEIRDLLKPDRTPAPGA
jgi:large conductance mechanosensitive channel